MDKEKILQSLRAKFAGTQNVVLDRVADHLSQTVTDESQLETAIDGVRPLVDSFSKVLQSESDRVSTKAQETALDNFRKKHNLDEDGKPIVKPDPTKEDPELEKMKKRLDDFESTKQKERLQELLKTKLSGKKIPESFIKGRVVESEDQLDTIVAEIEADYGGVKQHLINEGVLSEKPVDSFGNPDSVDADIEEWAKSKKTN